MKFYENKWTEIDSLEEKGLTKSALKIIDEIYTNARKNNKSEQVIKSFIYNLKYKNQIEENAFEKLCNELDSTAQKANFPNNAIMHSMLADMYWWYYQSNRWKFMNRTNTVNFNNNDMQTWTLDYLVKKIIDAYTNSLTNKKGLQELPITKYTEIIDFGTKPKKLRPTLYDFLAHKAIDFFSNTEIALTKPADNFELEEAYYFDDAQSFANREIMSSDFLSLHFHAICLMQDLLKFRLTDKKNKDALIDADLKRLSFVYEHSVNTKKDELYLNALQKLEQRFSKNPFSSEISYKIALHYKNSARKYDPFNKETKKYKFYKKTAHEICEKTIKKFPNTNASEHCKSLIVNIEKHDLSFTIEKIIPPKSNFSAKITYRNTNKLFFKIVKINRKKYKKLYQEFYYKKLYDKLIVNSEKIYEFSKDVPYDEDFNSHSTEVIFDKIENPGLYILFVSNNAKFTYKEAMASYKAFIVSNISYAKQKLKDGSYRFFVTNRTTGHPIKNVKCKFWYKNHNIKLKKVIYTDENGFVTFSPKEKIDYNNWQVDFKKDDDFLINASSIYSYKHNNRITRSKRTYFFTDRAIYRPGQTVYFKGITIKTIGNKNSVIRNNPQSVTLYDVNNQKVAELNLKTNKYGTFSGSFDIPMGLINGQFHISTYNETKYFYVEEYKRPKFEVEMLPFKGNYMLNDEVEIEGKATSYSGASISEGKVTYHITRTPKWRGWWYWFIPSESVEIAHGKAITDDNGKFKIKFKALPDLSFPENEFTFFRYDIKVDVMDLNGETQSTSSEMNIGYRALQVYLPLPNKINKHINEIDTTVKFIYNIYTQNLNDEFIEAKGEIKIFKLKDNPQIFKPKLWEKSDKHLYSKKEYYKLLPHNVFDDENEPTGLEKEKEVFSSQFNTKTNKKIDLNKFAKFASGNYVLEITSKDAFGNKVTYKHFFMIYSHNEKNMPTKLANLFIPVDNYCEPGEDATFLIGTSYKNTKIIYQIEHKGQIISEKILEVNNEQKIIKIPVKEEFRGNFSVHFIFMKENRLYNSSSVVFVPYTNKKLDIEFMTFRDKLYPGQKEEWKIKIKGNKGEKVMAEMLATLYDASLDQFKENSWDFDIYKSYCIKCSWESNTFSSINSSLIKENLDISILARNLSYDYFNWFDFSNYINFTNLKTPRRGVCLSKISLGKSTDDISKSEEILPSPLILETEEMDNEIYSYKLVGNNNTPKQKEDFSNVKVRTNFNETAFFYPHLETNENSEVIISFTIPESLTKWKMKGFATTQDLKYGFINEELITQKDLMLMPNSPRFFREFDKITFPVKISNISKENINGQVKLEFFDAITMKPIDNIFVKNENMQKNFSVKAESNTLVSWKLEIPEGLGAVTYKVVAKSDKFSDGEQKPVPVLTNRMLVTESMPLPVRGKGKTDFKFEKLINSGKSSTIQNHKLTLEFTSNPAWYAVQALPYLMEYPYECTEQTFSKFYANSIASHIANSNPKIKRVFDAWKQADAGALISNLEKNQELKAVILEETPWVLQGKNETERKKRVGLLFDLNKMGNELAKALKKIQKAQKPNGAWPWFKGMPESRYITQHIVAGMGHLDKLGIKEVMQNAKTKKMIRNAIGYLDIEIKKDYEWLKKHYTTKEMENNHLSSIAIQYLYGRSYFNDIQVPNASKEAYEYYKEQTKKYWLSQSKYMQGMIALYLHRNGETKIPADIIKSLKEKSINHKEMGMYWKDNIAGWHWYQAPIEQQALMIEAFDEVAKDLQSVNDMKIWLLKQKQTQDWKTTKATTEAVYALLMRGTDWLVSDKQIKIEMAGKHINPTKLDNVKIEAGTGYFKTSWNGSEIKPKMGNISVTKYDEGVSWGALYWQYFENLDKITVHEKTPLKLKKQLFIERLTERGKIIEPISEKAKLKIGDKIIVRIELRVDRRMEYIHMKDMRASSFEPINVISKYKYQDGLGYYESTKDASTNFFMDNLPKGTYVFEYPLRVTHEGNFSSGITTIQCMYAPEFTSHSEGIRIDVIK